MSSLIFSIDPEQVVVVTDTLATAPDGTPYLFTSKAHYLPHLKSIIAGTGSGRFSGEWAMHVNNEMCLRGIENLNYHASKSLENLWDEHKNKFSVSSNITTTVYLFGISEETNQMTGYAYRSTNKFKSEQLPFGIGIKPECTYPEGNPLGQIELMMNEQRMIQSRKPLDERLYIGGQAIAIHLTKDSCSIIPLFDFSDFKENWEQMIKKN